MAVSKFSEFTITQSLGSHLSNLHLRPFLVLIAPSLDALSIQRLISFLTNGTFLLYLTIISLASCSDNPKDVASLVLPIPYIKPKPIVLACERSIPIISATVW